MIVVKAGKGFPAPSPRGFLWVQGRRLARSTGVQAGNVVSYAPADVVVPNDTSLVGVEYTVQGYCGGRLSNGIFEGVGIGA